MIFSQLIDKKTKILAEINPQRIYVENIRSFFGIPFKIAKLLCEMAVKERIFSKKYGVFCPNCGRLIKAHENSVSIEQSYTCDVCLDLENSKYRFDRDEIEILEFYQLNENSN